MHIVYTTNEFITEHEYNGPSNYINNISTIMGNRGHRITILVASDKIETICWSENVTIIRVMPMTGNIIHEILMNSKDNDKKVIAARLNISYAFLQMINKINKENPIDIIDGRFFGFSFYRNKNLPLVIRVSCLIPEGRLANNKEYRFKISRKDWLLSEKVAMYSLKRADAIYTPSKIVREKVKERIHKNVTIIESPFLFDGLVLDDSIYYKEFSGKKYLLFYGALSYLKGVHDIAQIIYKFLNNYKDFYFLFIGNDKGCEMNGNKMSMLQYVKAEAKEFADRVLYLPKLREKEKLYSLVMHAYACVLPSRVDNLPNTCIESMALGKIVIGTKGASFEQLIKDKENGLLIEIESPVALMKAIDYLLSLPDDKIKEMESKAKESVKKLEPDAVYENILSFYQEVIHKHKNLAKRKDK